MIGLICLALSPLSYIWNGYVLACLWSWFVVTPFDAPKISIPVAIGIGLIANLLTSSLRAKDSRDADEVYIASLGHSFLVPLVALIAGAITKGFLS